MPVPRAGLDLDAWAESIPKERNDDSEFNLLIYRFRSFVNEVKDYQRLHSNCSASTQPSAAAATAATTVASEGRLKLDVSSSPQAATNISIQSANSNKNGASHDDQLNYLSSSASTASSSAVGAPQHQATSQPQKLNGQHVINLRKKFLQNQDCGLPAPKDNITHHSSTTARPSHKILLQNFSGRSVDQPHPAKVQQHYNSSHNLVSLNLNSSSSPASNGPAQFGLAKPEIKQRSQSGSNSRSLMSKSTERLDKINNNNNNGGGGGGGHLGGSSLENSLDMTNNNQLNSSAASQRRISGARDSRLLHNDDDNIYDAVSPDGDAPLGSLIKSDGSRVLPSAPDYTLASLNSSNRMYPNLAKIPPISIELTRPSRDDTHIPPPPAVPIATTNNLSAASNQDYERSNNSFNSSVMLGETSNNTSSSLSLVPSYRDQEYGNYVNIDFFLKRSKSPSFDDLDEKASSQRSSDGEDDDDDGEDDDTTQMSNSYSNSQLCDDSLRDLSPRELAKKLSSNMERDNSSSSLTPASSGDFLDESRSPTAFQTATSTFSKHIDINSKYGSFFTPANDGGNHRGLGRDSDTAASMQARSSTTPRQSTSSQLSATGLGPKTLGLIHESQQQTATSPRHSLSRDSSQIYSDTYALNEAHTSMRSFLSDLKLSPVDDVFEDKAQRRIVKESFAVESCGRRKLRHLFLFNDVIVCAKYQASSKQKFTFDVKWYLNLNGVAVSDINEGNNQAKMDKESVENQILAIRTNLMLLRGRMQQIKRSKDKRPSKIIKKLKKKRTELEAELVLLLPHLPLVIKHTNGKKFLFFLSSNFDRNQWVESIRHLQSQLPPTKSSSSSPSSSELQAWIQTCRKNLNPSLGTFLLRSNCDDDLLYGDLFINLSTITGLPKPGHYYFCFEVDSYGHFSQKASSVVLRITTTDQDLNEEYVLPLDGAHTLRILLYEDMGQSAKPSVIGKAHVELSRSWFFDKPVERLVEFSPSCRSLVRLSYSSLELLSMRIPHAKLCPTFGLDITQVCKKEKTTVPMLVQLCVNEVERRGMREVGIYRMSGTSTDIQRLKKAFETNPYVAELLLRDIDINSVTGFLKTYLREMPEGLFINKLYVKFVAAFNIPQSDSADRTKRMLDLFHKIPLTNQHTIIYLVEHLVKVNKYELHNKMSLTNLATVLGPNILRPPVDSPGNESSDPFTAVVIGSMSQAGILYFFLNRKASNLHLTELDVSELEQIRTTSEA